MRSVARRRGQGRRPAADGERFLGSWPAADAACLVEPRDDEPAGRNQRRPDPTDAASRGGTVLPRSRHRHRHLRRSRVVHAVSRGRRNRHLRFADGLGEGGSCGRPAGGQRLDWPGELCARDSPPIVSRPRTGRAAPGAGGVVRTPDDGRRRQPVGAGARRRARDDADERAPAPAAADRRRLEADRHGSAIRQGRPARGPARCHGQRPGRLRQPLQSERADPRIPDLRPFAGAGRGGTACPRRSVLRAGAVDRGAHAVRSQAPRRRAAHAFVAW